MAKRPPAARDPAKPLIAILPLWLIVLIAVGALLGTMVFLLWGLLSPNTFQTPFTRFILCLGIAVCAGLFLFVCYPFALRLPRNAALGLVAPLVGPAALIIILFSFISYNMPLPEWGRVHQFSDQEGGRTIENVAFSTVQLRFDGQEPLYYLIPRPNRFGLWGVYVIYPEGKQELRATLKAAHVYQEEEVQFFRNIMDPIPLKLQLKEE